MLKNALGRSVVTSGANAKADSKVATKSPGKMRNARLARKRHGSPVSSKLCVTRKPLMAKKTKTPTRPRIDWLPVSQISGSWSCVPSAIRKECEKTTEAAATRRSASKLFRREFVRPASPGRTCPAILQSEQPGDALAVPRGVAKGDLGGLGPLEVELQVVLPGIADAAM